VDNAFLAQHPSGDKAATLRLEDTLLREPRVWMPPPNVHSTMPEAPDRGEAIDQVRRI
jgi:hypothetical protein